MTTPQRRRLADGPPTPPTRGASKAWQQQAAKQTGLHSRVKAKFWFGKSEELEIERRRKRTRDSYDLYRSIRGSDDNEETTAEPGQLETELEAARETVERLKAENKQLVDNNNRLNSERISAELVYKHRLDDGEVKQRWRRLDYTIKQIARIRYKYHEASSNRRPIAPIFQKFAARPDDLLHSQWRPYLFRAFIWNEVVQRVFGDGGTLWSWPQKIATRRALQLYGGWVRENHMGRDEYHQWLSAHTTKAYKKYGIDPYGVRDVAAKIRDQLQDAEVPHFDEEMCTSFEDLIRDAAELDVDLRMCRAWFLIFMYNEDETRFGDTGSWNRHGMEFRPSDWMEEVEMEEVGETSSSPVALVVSPALIKRGNSSGSNYDQGLTIANRAVLRCKG